MAIIQLMIILGYMPEIKGMCYGIAHTAVQSALRHNVDTGHSRFDEYLKRSQAIAQFSNEDRAQLKELATKWNEKDSPLSKEQKKELLETEIRGITFQEMLAYAESIAMYYGLNQSYSDPDIKKNLMPFTSNQDFNKAAELLTWTGRDNGDTEQPNKVYQVSASKQMIKKIDSVETLKEFLEKENPENKDCALTLDMPEHTMALICHKNKWYLVDHDKVVSADNDEISALFTQLSAHQETIFAITRYVNQKSNCADERPDLVDFKKDKNELKKGLYLALKNGHAAAVETFMTGLKDFSLDKEVLEEIVLAKDKNGAPGLFLALQNGHAAAVEEFMAGLQNLDLDKFDKEVLEEILLAKNKNGAPGLLLALQEGHAVAVEAFMVKLLAFKDKLLPVDIKEIVLAKNKNGTSGLSLALENGHAAAVEAFMIGLKDLNLDKFDKEVLKEILLAKRQQDGVPGLSFALNNGHAAAVEAFMIGLKDLSLDKEALEEIVLAKANGTPGLSFALNNGHAAAVEEFMSGLLAFKDKLAPGDIKEILLAKANGVPGLLLALKNGHAAAVEAFMIGLKDLNLEKKALQEILLAKRQDGVPGLSLALQKGQAAAVKEFMAELKDLSLDKEALEEIVLAKANGVPGLLLALQNGHAAAVKEFMSELKDLSLDKEALEEIVLAKNENGVPGLLFALQNGHAAAVEAFMTGLQNLDLDKEAKKEILLAKDKNDVPGLLFALVCGHDAAVGTFMAELQNLDLSKEAQKEIVLAKDKDGATGWFYPLQGGRVDAIKGFFWMVKTFDINENDLRPCLMVKTNTEEHLLPLVIKRAVEQGARGAIKSFKEGLEKLGFFKNDKEVQEVLQKAFAIAGLKFNIEPENNSNQGANFGMFNQKGSSNENEYKFK